MDASKSPRPERSLTPDGRVAADQPPAGALPQGTQLHEFKLLASLGEGGFSIVYAAHDTQLHREVAIKEYMPASFANRSGTTQVSLRSERHRSTFEAGLRSFLDEARLLAQFKHRALVEVLRFWEQNGTAYMAMPHYSGKTMRLLLREQSVQSSERWLRSLFAPLLDVLELLHARQVYHRDIAPDNILIQQDGTPVLLDLGSARRVIGEEQQALTVVVKPGYAPIEQYAEDLGVPQGPWTDIYAVGAVLYFAITGHAPPASVSRMMKDTLQPLAGTPRDGYSQSFLKAVDHALALQPDQRPQSVPELRELLGIREGNWQPIPLSELSRKAPNAAPVNYVDEGQTVVLGAEEIARLASRLGRGEPAAASTHAAVANAASAAAALATAAAAAAIPSAPASKPLPDPFAQPTAKPVRDSSYADVQDLLSGQLSRNAGRVSVPHGQARPAPAASTAITAPAASRRYVVLTSLAVVLVALLVGAGLGSLGQHLPSTSATVGTAPQNPAPASTAAVDTPPAPPTAVASPPAAAGADMNADADADANLWASGDAETRSLAATGTALETLPAVAPADSNAAPMHEPPALTAITPPAPPEPQSDTRAAANVDGNAATAKTNRKEVETPVASATLNFSVQPWGEIWIDGQKRGISPPIKQLPLEPGEHRIELRSPGFSTWRRTLNLGADGTVDLAHNFQAPGATPAEAPAAMANETTAAKPVPVPVPAPTSTKASTAPAADKPEVKTFRKGVVSLSIVPWGEVWIDGKKLGVSPPLHELRLAEGEYRIELRNASFPTAARTIQVSASQRISIKHRFESAARQPLQ